MGEEAVRSASRAAGGTLGADEGWEMESDTWGWDGEPVTSWSAAQLCWVVAGELPACSGRLVVSVLSSHLPRGQGVLDTVGRWAGVAGAGQVALLPVELGEILARELGVVSVEVEETGRLQLSALSPAVREVAAALYPQLRERYDRARWRGQPRSLADAQRALREALELAQDSLAAP